MNADDAGGTERNEAATLSGDRYLALYLKAPVMLHSIDASGRLIEVSDQWLRVLGYEREEVLGERATKFLTAESRRHAELVAIPRLIETGAIDDVSYQFKRKDGETVDIQLSAIAEHDESGAFHSLAVLHDVTRQMRAEEDVVRFREIIDRAGDAIFLADTETGRILDCNATAIQRLQYTRDELLALDVEHIDLLVPQPWSKLVETIKAAGKPVVADGLHRRKDGSTFPVEISISHRTFKDKAYVVGMARDITERNQLEGQLRQAQKMEAIGSLTAGIAHNFNNMLMIILGNTEIALKRAGADVSENLASIRGAGERAADMVAQLLAYSRHGEHAEHKPIAMSQLVAETIDICRNTFDRKISIESVASPQLPPISGNPNQIQQVLLNLCLNARDALEDTPAASIVIETELVSPDSRHIPSSARPGAQYYVRTDIADNGRGMDEATLERIFDPFFTTKDIDKGTGLGLSTAIGIVRQHKGWIACESRAGHGSIFSVFLPVGAGDAAARETRREHAAGASATGTVLVIEDEPSLATLLTSAFELAGFTTLVETDGLRGLDSIRAHAHEIDLVLLDLSLPRMSGEQILQSLRSEFPRTKVVVLTGHGLPADQLEGAAAVISKPVELEHLMERVRAVLDA